VKAFDLGTRLERDLGGNGLVELEPDVLLEITDAINGGLQQMHALASYESKIVTGSIAVAAPLPITLGVTNGSTTITGQTFSGGQLFGTIKITGDPIDNKITGPTQILHPYSGTTGTVAATIYFDGVAVSEPYDELVGDPRILETGRSLVHHQEKWERLFMFKQVMCPVYYQVEANARNRNSIAPSVIRFNTLPDKAYRMEAQFTIAPVRITTADLSPSEDDAYDQGANIPLRDELIETYLLPIARGILSSSERWKTSNKEVARADAQTAAGKYSALVPRHLATPRNSVVTRYGY
jgi:hypothetical protein